MALSDTSLGNRSLDRIILYSSFHELGLGEIISCRIMMR